MLRPDGVIELYHFTTARPQRCCGIEIDRFPVRPPATPPKYDARPSVRCSLAARVRDYQRALIVWALGRTDNEVQAAADLLSMKRTTLRAMIRRLGGRRRVQYDLQVPRPLA